MRKTYYRWTDRPELIRPSVEPGVCQKGMNLSSWKCCINNSLDWFKKLRPYCKHVFVLSLLQAFTPFRHRILVYVFRFALILQCTLGAFIVSLNYKFSITFFRNLGERPPQKRNISIAKSQCWAPSNKLLLQNEERYLSISLCNRITFLLK